MIAKTVPGWVFGYWVLDVRFCELVIVNAFEIAGNQLSLFFWDSFSSLCVLGEHSLMQ